MTLSGLEWFRACLARQRQALSERRAAGETIQGILAAEHRDQPVSCIPLAMRPPRPEFFSGLVPHRQAAGVGNQQEAPPPRVGRSSIPNISLLVIYVCLSPEAPAFTGGGFFRLSWKPSLRAVTPDRRWRSPRMDRAMPPTHKPFPVVVSSYGD